MLDVQAAAITYLELVSTLSIYCCIVALLCIPLILLIRVVLPKPILVTIPYSHYVELARWALQHRAVVFTELGMPVGLHVLGGLLRLIFYAGTDTDASVQTSYPGSDIIDKLPWWAPHLRSCFLRRLTSVPFLIDERGRIEGDSWAVLRRCAFAVDAEFRHVLDHEVGPDVRRIAYYYLLRSDPQHYRRMQSCPKMLMPLFDAVERVCGTKASIARLCDLTDEAIQAAEVRLRARFEALSLALSADPYLGSGDGGLAFGGADLAWSALVAIIVLAPKYGSGAVEALPPLDEWPLGFRALHEELRDTRAGQHVLKCYQEHRCAAGASEAAAVAESAARGR